MTRPPSSRFRLNRRDSPGSYAPNRTLYQRWIKDWWALELLAVLASCALTLVLCIVLYISDNELVQTFGFDPFIGGGITLATIVAILANLIVAFALYAISECLSQLKWLWYWDSGRPLRDIDTYDQASRGALGSTKLLWRLRVIHNPIASLGAFLTISQLVIAPLAQQAVVLGERSIPDLQGSAFLPQTRSFREPDTARMANMPAGYNRLGHGMKSELLTGLFSNLDTMFEVGDPFCSTGNCTIPKYTSLETCNDSANVTSKLEARTRGSEQVWCLPNTTYCLSAERKEEEPVMIIGSAAGAPAPVYNLTGERTQDQKFSSEPLHYSSVTFTNHTNPIADFYIIYQTPNSTNGVAAQEFMFDWCVLSLAMSTKNAMRSDLNGTGSTLLLDWHNEGKGIDTNMTTDVNGTTYRVDAHSHNTLQRYLQLLLNGTMYYSPASGFAAENDVVQMFGEVLHLQGKGPESEALPDPAPLGPRDPFADNPQAKNHTKPADGSSDPASVVGIGDGPFPWDFAPDDLDWGAMGAHMYNMALAMSDFARIRNADSELAMGTAFETRQVVMVSWGFISAPILFAVASLNFFVVVAAHGRGQQHSGTRHRPLVWKTSGIATLRGLDAHLHRSVGGMRGVSGMDGDAGSMTVRLLRDRSGWRLVVDDRHEAPRPPAKDVVSSTHTPSSSMSETVVSPMSRRVDSGPVLSPVSRLGSLPASSPLSPPMPAPSITHPGPPMPAPSITHPGPPRPARYFRRSEAFSMV